MAQIDTLKTLLQINDKSQDDLINALIEQCSAEYMMRTHQTDTDVTVINAMVIEKYNRLGNEGIQSFSYSGINESYESDYSESVQKLIKSRARMMTI